MGTVIPDIAIEIISAVSGLIVTIGIPLILARMNKFEKLYTTVFGIKDVEHMSGLVGIVEAHDTEMQELEEDIVGLREGQLEIEERIAKLEKQIVKRKTSSDDD